MINQQQNNPFLMALQNKNPIAFLENIAKNDPRMQNTLKMINQFNGATQSQQEEFIRRFCEQKGINLNDVIKQFQQFSNSNNKL